jgi:hypothetical protein
LFQKVWGAKTRSRSLIGPICRKNGTGTNTLARQLGAPIGRVTPKNAEVDRCDRLEFRPGAT